MTRFFSISFLCLMIVFTAYSQNATEINQPQEKNEAEQQKKIEFLRQAIGDAGNLRSVENRISFSAELAAMMWDHNDAEARLVFTRASSDLRQLFANYDGMMNSFGPPDEDGDGFSYGFFGDDSEKGVVIRRFGIAVGVREQVAISIAEKDPDLAYSFFSDTASSLTNPQLKNLMEMQDKQLAGKLAEAMAKANPEKALKFAIESLKDGVTHQHISLLETMAKKDREKAAEFGKAIVSKLKDQKFQTYELYLLNSFLDTGKDLMGSGDQTPIISRDDLRDIAEVLFQKINAAEEGISYGMQFLPTLEEFAPNRATQLKARLNVGSGSGSGNGSGSGAGVTRSPSVRNPDRFTTSNSKNPRQIAREEEERTIKDVGTINKEMPDAERQRIIAQVRKLVAESKSKDKKITALSMLAAGVARYGDKDLANEIMREAVGLANPYPKNYKDLMLNWMLIAGYAEIDTERSFSMLEDLIYRLNGTISAFVSVGEFVDVNGDMIHDGEVQVGAFGGSMIRGLTRDLGFLSQTLNTLSAADLDRMKAITDRFDRPEVRVLAKTMVLRTLFESESGATNSKAVVSQSGTVSPPPPPARPRRNND